MFRNALILVVLLSFFNCKEEEKQTSSPESAEEIIKKSIAVAGGDVFDSSDISFDFRDAHFKAIRNNGKFELERQFKDSLTEIRDVLKNSGFERHENGERVELTDSIRSLYAASVNAVHYFSVLPYGLNGKAVHKTYLGTKNIKGKDYHKIKITFSEDGGGEDFEDEFIYWIDPTSYKVDYLAYSYEEVDGQGFRFREAYNQRMVNGLHFADYNNYKPASSTIKLEDLDAMFSAGELELLSKVELKNVKVEHLN